YLGIGVARAYARLPAAVRTLVRTCVETWPVSDRKVTFSLLLKRFVAAAELPGVERHRIWTSTIRPDLLASLGVAALPLLSVTADTPADAPLLDVVQRIDLETSLAEGLLTKADRASMGSALELRAPYLDQAVMEFAATLPVEERVRGLTTKVFLKRFARRYLP